MEPLSRLALINLAFFLAITFSASAGVKAAENAQPGEKEDEAPAEMFGLPLLLSEDFENGAARWLPTDGKAWKVKEEDGNHVYSLFGKSEYEPPVRSPFNLSLISDLCVGDFVLEARLKQTGREYNHRDLCVFFGHNDPSHFYYVHIATKADAHANSVFLVNGDPRVAIAKERTEGTKWLDGHYHTVRLTRDTQSGLIQVFFDDMENPIMIAEDKTFLTGRIGLGSFDDTGDFDDLRVWGRKVEEDPKSTCE